MATKPQVEVRSANSQKDQRWNATVYDQHTSARFPRGRPWWGVMEYPSDRQKEPSFVGNLMPGDSDDPMHSSWNAPWMPDVVKTWNNVGTYRLDLKKQRITWLYAAIASADRLAMEDYYHKAATIAYEKGWPAPKLGEPVPYQIRQILFSPPRSPKIAEAAMAGDQWILGFSPQVNEELQALLAGVRAENLTTVPEPLPESMQKAAQIATSPDLARLIAEGVQSALKAEKDAVQAAKQEQARKIKEGQRVAAEKRAAKKLAASVAA